MRRAAICRCNAKLTRRAAVIEPRSAGHLRQLGLARGMRTLRDDGLRLVRAGITTVEEVLRVADVGGE